MCMMTATTGKQTIDDVRREIELLCREVKNPTARMIENVRANAWGFHEHVNS